MTACSPVKSGFFWNRKAIRLQSRFLQKIAVYKAHTKGQEKPAAGEDASMQQAGRLLDEYGNMILRFAYSYLHNMSDAEDIVQDTLIQYLCTRPRLESPAHEKAWLLRVAANLSKNRIRYNHIRQADPLEETLAAEGREDLSFVWEAVRQLPEPYREVVHLFYYETYTTAEIARILNRKETTIRSDLRRGRMKLKEILEEVYDFD